MASEKENKSTSYYEWEQSFKKGDSRNQCLNDEKPNSLGIPPEELKDFLKSWREKNL
jgi:hypothetical protein